MTLSFDELTPYGDNLRMETKKIDVDRGSPEDNEKAIAEISANYDPPGAWILNSWASRIWRAAPTPPRAATRVAAYLGSPVAVGQTVYEFDRPEDAQAMLDVIAKAREEYPSFTRTVESGEVGHYTPRDLADQLEDLDVFAYGYADSAGRNAFVVSGKHLLFVSISYTSANDADTFDAVGLINQAIAKFRAATT